MDALIGLVCIAICVLQVVLFFKIWGMTNTTKVIQSKLEEIVEMMKHAEGKQVGIHSVEWYVNNGDLEAAAGNKDLAKEYYKKALYIVENIERSKRKMADEIKKKITTI